MSRRAVYMYGVELPAGPTGQVGAGLGQATSTGTVGAASRPTVDIIATTGQEATVDGVRMVFQMTPGTEAPAEMNICFPDLKALLHGRERDAQRCTTC